MQELMSNSGNPYKNLPESEMIDSLVYGSKDWKKSDIVPVLQTLTGQSGNQTLGTTERYQSKNNQPTGKKKTQADGFKALQSDSLTSDDFEPSWSIGDIEAQRELRQREELRRQADSIMKTGEFDPGPKPSLGGAKDARGNAVKFNWLADLVGNTDPEAVQRRISLAEDLNKAQATTRDVMEGAINAPRTKPKGLYSFEQSANLFNTDDEDLKKRNLISLTIQNDVAIERIDGEDLIFFNHVKDGKLQRGNLAVGRIDVDGNIRPINYTFDGSAVLGANNSELNKGDLIRDKDTWNKYLHDIDTGKININKSDNLASSPLNWDKTTENFVNLFQQDPQHSVFTFYKPKDWVENGISKINVYDIGQQLLGAISEMTAAGMTGGALGLTSAGTKGVMIGAAGARILGSEGADWASNRQTLEQAFVDGSIDTVLTGLGVKGLGNVELSKILGKELFTAWSGRNMGAAGKMAWDAVKSNWKSLLGSAALNTAGGVTKAVVNQAANDVETNTVQPATNYVNTSNLIQGAVEGSLDLGMNVGVPIVAKSLSQAAETLPFIKNYITQSSKDLKNSSVNNTDKTKEILANNADDVVKQSTKVEYDPNTRTFKSKELIDAQQQALLQKETEQAMASGANRVESDVETGETKFLKDERINDPSQETTPEQAKLQTGAYLKSADGQYLDTTKSDNVENYVDHIFRNQIIKDPRSKGNVLPQGMRIALGEDASKAITNFKSKNPDVGIAPLIQDVVNTKVDADLTYARENVEEYMADALKDIRDIELGVYRPTEAEMENFVNGTAMKAYASGDKAKRYSALKEVIVYADRYIDELTNIVRTGEIESDKTPEEIVKTAVYDTFNVKNDNQFQLKLLKNYDSVDPLKITDIRESFKKTLFKDPQIKALFEEEEVIIRPNELSYALKEEPSYNTGDVAEYIDGWNNTLINNTIGDIWGEGGSFEKAIANLEANGVQPKQAKAIVTEINKAVNNTQQNESGKVVLDADKINTNVFDKPVGPKITPAAKVEEVKPDPEITYTTVVPEIGVIASGPNSRLTSDIVIATTAPELLVKFSGGKLTSTQALELKKTVTNSIVQQTNYTKAQIIDYGKKLRAQRAEDLKTNPNAKYNSTGLLTEPNTANTIDLANYKPTNTDTNVKGDSEKLSSQADKPKYTTDTRIISNATNEFERNIFEIASEIDAKLAKQASDDFAKQVGLTEDEMWRLVGPVADRVNSARKKIADEQNVGKDSSPNEIKVNTQLPISKKVVIESKILTNEVKQRLNTPAVLKLKDGTTKLIDTKTLSEQFGKAKKKITISEESLNMLLNADWNNLSYEERAVLSASLTKETKLDYPSLIQLRDDILNEANNKIVSNQVKAQSTNDAEAKIEDVAPSTTLDNNKVDAVSEKTKEKRKTNTPKNTKKETDKASQNVSSKASEKTKAKKAGKTPSASTNITKSEIVKSSVPFFMLPFASDDDAESEFEELLGMGMPLTLAALLVGRRMKAGTGSATAWLARNMGGGIGKASASQVENAVSNSVTTKTIVRNYLETLPEDMPYEEKVAKMNEFKDQIVEDLVQENEVLNNLPKGQLAQKAETNPIIKSIYEQTTEATQRAIAKVKPVSDAMNEFMQITPVPYRDAVVKGNIRTRKELIAFDLAAKNNPELTAQDIAAGKDAIAGNLANNAIDELNRLQVEVDMQVLEQTLGNFRGIIDGYTEIEVTKQINRALNNYPMAQYFPDWNGDWKFVDFQDMLNNADKIVANWTEIDAEAQALKSNIQDRKKALKENVYDENVLQMELMDLETEYNGLLNSGEYNAFKKAFQVYTEAIDMYDNSRKHVYFDNRVAVRNDSKNHNVGFAVTPTNGDPTLSYFSYYPTMKTAEDAKFRFYEQIGAKQDPVHKEKYYVEKVVENSDGTTITERIDLQSKEFTKSQNANVRKTNRAKLNQAIDQLIGTSSKMANLNPTNTELVKTASDTLNQAILGIEDQVRQIAVDGDPESIELQEAINAVKESVGVIGTNADLSATEISDNLRQLSERLHTPDTFVGMYQSRDIAGYDTNWKGDSFTSENFLNSYLNKGKEFEETISNNAYSNSIDAAKTTLAMSGLMNNKTYNWLYDEQARLYKEGPEANTLVDAIASAVNTSSLLLTSGMIAFRVGLAPVNLSSNFFQQTMYNVRNGDKLTPSLIYNQLRYYTEAIANTTENDFKNAATFFGTPKGNSITALLETNQKLNDLIDLQSNGEYLQEMGATHFESEANLKTSILDEAVQRGMTGETAVKELSVGNNSILSKGLDAAHVFSRKADEVARRAVISEAFDEVMKEERVNLDLNDPKALTEFKAKVFQKANQKMDAVFGRFDLKFKSDLEKKIISNNSYLGKFAPTLLRFQSPAILTAANWYNTGQRLFGKTALSAGDDAAAIKMQQTRENNYYNTVGLLTLAMFIGGTAQIPFINDTINIMNAVEKYDENGEEFVQDAMDMNSTTKLEAGTRELIMSLGGSPQNADMAIMMVKRGVLSGVTNRKMAQEESFMQLMIPVITSSVSKLASGMASDKKDLGESITNAFLQGTIKDAYQAIGSNLPAGYRVVDDYLMMQNIHGDSIEKYDLGDALMDIAFGKPLDMQISRKEQLASGETFTGYSGNAKFVSSFFKGAGIEIVSNNAVMTNEEMSQIKEVKEIAPALMLGVADRLKDPDITDGMQWSSKVTDNLFDKHGQAIAEMLGVSDYKQGDALPPALKQIQYGISRQIGNNYTNLAARRAYSDFVKTNEGEKLGKNYTFKENADALNNQIKLINRVLPQFNMGSSDAFSQDMTTSHELGKVAMISYLVTQWERYNTNYNSPSYDKLLQTVEAIYTNADK